MVSDIVDAARTIQSHKIRVSKPTAIHVKVESGVSVHLVIKFSLCYRPVNS